MTDTIELTRSGDEVKATLDGKRLDHHKSLKIANHSPQGFEYGYSGSGPAQLALSILLEKLEELFKDAYTTFCPFEIVYSGAREDTTTVVISDTAMQIEFYGKLGPKDLPKRIARLLYQEFKEQIISHLRQNEETIQLDLEEWIKAEIRKRAITYADWTWRA